MTTTLLEEPVVRPSTAPSQRLRIYPDHTVTRLRYPLAAKSSLASRWDSWPSEPSTAELFLRPHCSFF